MRRLLQKDKDGGVDEQNTRLYIVPHLVRKYIGLSRSNKATTAIENPWSSFQEANAQKHFNNLKNTIFGTDFYRFDIKRNIEGHRDFFNLVSKADVFMRGQELSEEDNAILKDYCEVAI